MKKTIFITGASSGLGKASANYFSSNGWNVAATMRSPEKETELIHNPNIKIFKLDVTKTSQIKTAVEQAIAAFGHIDVVLNNAGMGTYGALELAKEEDIDWQFAVNTRGPINVIRAFLPHFRARGAGMFINVSSFMGITTAVPLGSLYNMSKFALEGLTEGLYYELKPLNIDLRLIEQGGTNDTNFADNITWNTDPAVTAYNALTDKIKNLIGSADASMKDDKLVIVEAIAALANRESNAFRTVVGSVGKGLMAMRNTMPIEDYLEKMNAPYLD